MPERRDGQVAIIIPCYRQARFLARAIESALRQSVPAAEIIVVDDGSPEDVAAVVARYPEVQLERQDNRGPSAARNRGLAATSAERIIFLDADDVLLPEAISRGLDCFADHPDAAFVYGSYSNRRWRRSRIELRPPTGRRGLLRENRIGMIGAVMFDRAKLREVGGFDEGLRIAEDWDLYLRLSRRFAFAGHGHHVACYTRHWRNVTNNVARMRRGIALVRELERERGLSSEEASAWSDGAGVIASAYPRLGERIARLARRLIPVSARRARRP